MPTSKSNNRIGYYLVAWVLRLVINLFKFSLLASLIGTLVLVFIMVYLVMIGGDGATPVNLEWMTSIITTLSYILTDGTGNGEISGGMQEFGFPVLSFFAPYILAIDVVVSLAEALTEKSLFSWFQWSLLSRLIVLLVVFVGLAVLSVFSSNVPHAEFPYWLRVLMLVVLYAWTAGQLLFIHVVSVMSEAVFKAFARRQAD
ncbi:MAG: hypothetical protein WBA57_22290 [Elainellaceae cyanobacterium]